MKSNEERLRFKNHFFKLGQGRIIPLDKTDYWCYYWLFPETSNDIFELLTANDIQTIRDQNLLSFLLLIRVLCTKLIDLTNLENFPHTYPNCTLEALNCIRFLTKLLPFLYELPNYTDDLEDFLFWQESFDPHQLISTDFKLTPPTDKDKLLGPKFLKALVDLLFIKGFTLEASDASKSQLKPENGNAVFTVWEPGIGTTSKYHKTNLILDINRATVLKLMLTVVSTSFYSAPSNVVSKGSKFLTLLVTTTPRIELLTLVCSLINLTCRSARSTPAENSLFYSQVPLTKARHLCVTYSIQLLTVMIVYPLPSSVHTSFLTELNLISTPKPYNLARLYVGKLHKENELMFLASYLLNILRVPLQSSKDSESSKFMLNIKGIQPSLWATETIMLLWELFQCNKAFRSVVGARYIQEIVIILLFYIFTYHDNHTHRNLVRISSYFILHMSADDQLMKPLVHPISAAFYESLPNNFKLSIRPGTPREFVIIQIVTILTTITPSEKESLYAVKNISTITPSQVHKKHANDLLAATLVEIFYNLIPIVDETLPFNDIPIKKLSNSNPGGGLSYTACSSISQLITKFSSKAFLMESPFHGDMLALIFRAICTAAIKLPKASRMILFSMLKNEKIYDAVWNTIFSLDTVSFSGNKLNSIKDEENEEDDTASVTESLQANTTIASDNDLDSNFGDSLSRVETRRSDQLSINSPTPKLGHDITESQFIQSLNQPGSGRNSVISLPNTPTFDPQDIFEAKEESDEEADAIEAALRPKPPTGMSQKKREKLPKDSPIPRTWGGNDALRIILTILIPNLKLSLKEVWSSKEGPSVDSYLLVKHIESTDFDLLIKEYKSQINYDFLPTTPFEPLKFTWSHLSLGWYISLLNGRIYNSVENVNSHVSGAGNIMSNLSSSLASFSKFTSGWSNLTKATTSKADMGNDSPEVLAWVTNNISSVNNWSHTAIKLFKIEFSPRDSFFPIDTKGFGIGNNQSAPGTPGTPGGMNDMANSLVRRFSDFRLNNTGRTTPTLGSIGSFTPIDENEPNLGKYGKRNSVTSLHSLNAMNRSRTSTPRNSISM